MRKLTTKEFIERAISKHGDFYNYSKVIYTSKSIKVVITCLEHGDFEQTPDAHINRGDGCPKCRLKRMTLSTEEFIIRANAAHNNKFTYNKSIYTLAGFKVVVTCPKHGDFNVRANQHLSGQDCNKCLTETKTSNTKEFIHKAKQIHGNLYTYDKVKYETNIIKIEVICNTCNKVFSLRPSDHLLGTGCPSCAKTGFDSTKPAILYYLKILLEENKYLYKIGITNRTINERFQLKDLAKIQIIKQEKFELGKDALNKETVIKRKFKEYQYKGQNVLSSGNTELFIKDIYLE